MIDDAQSEVSETTQFSQDGDISNETLESQTTSMVTDTDERESDVFINDGDDESEYDTMDTEFVYDYKFETSETDYQDSSSPESYGHEQEEPMPEDEFPHREHVSYVAVNHRVEIKWKCLPWESHIREMH